MKDEIKSNLTGITYCLNEVIRIVNPVQSALYVSMGVKLIDMYTSINRVTNKPCWVWLFKKKDTKEAFDVWCKNRGEKVE